MQVLRAVVTSGSVTAAAAGLGYTPSAVSQQIATLEKEAGTPLLTRVGRGVRPTAAGWLLTEHAAVIGRQVAEAETALADLREGRTGRLAVRYFVTAGADLVAPALARFRAAYPDVRVDLELAGSDDMAAEVRQGRADLALVAGSAGTPPDGLRFVHLLDDPYRAVLPRDHPLAERSRLDLADLAVHPWITGDRPGPCLDAVLDACATAGFSPDVAVDSEDYATAQGFVAAGLGVAVIPRLGLEAPHPGVTVRELCSPEPVRSIHALVREPSADQPLLRGLLDAFRAVRPEPAPAPD